jgi:hypothetical protein
VLGAISRDKSPLTLVWGLFFFLRFVNIHRNSSVFLNIPRLFARFRKMSIIFSIIFRDLERTFFQHRNFNPIGLRSSAHADRISGTWADVDTCIEYVKSVACEEAGQVGVLL